jgi:hypothetical protein
MPFARVGSVMAAITREAEISHELVGVQAKLQEANSRLADLDGALLVRSLGSTCRPGLRSGGVAQDKRPDDDTPKHPIGTSSAAHFEATTCGLC